MRLGFSCPKSYLAGAFQLPYHNLYTWSIPVSVQSYFDAFSAEDEQTGLDWFLLSQTFNQKGKLLFHISSLLYQKYLISLIWWWLPCWRTHGGNYVCEVVVAKFWYQILTTITCLGFFNIEEFDQSCHIGCLYRIFLDS